MGFLINCSDTSILLCNRKNHPSSVKDPWACWLMTLAKWALTCEPSIGPQMHGCRGQTLHAGSWLQPQLSFHCFPQISSPSSITLPSQVPSAWETLLPAPSFISLVGSLKNGGIVCRCAWRAASPSALGEHVVWECLRWRSFKLSPTQHAGV